jgi:hypothetical protein
MPTLLTLFKEFELDCFSVETFKAFNKYYLATEEPFYFALEGKSNLSFQQELLSLFVLGHTSCTPSGVKSTNSIILSLSNYLSTYDQLGRKIGKDFFFHIKDPFDLNTLEIILTIIKKHCRNSGIYTSEKFLLNTLKETYFPTNEKLLWETSSRYDFPEHDKIDTNIILDFISKNLKQPSVLPTSNKQETNKMNTLLNTATTSIASQPNLHKDAVIQASLQEVGKIAIQATKEMVKPHLPPIAAMFIDHALADLVVASGIAVILTAVKPTDKKAIAISKAVLVVGYSKAIGTLQIPKFVSNLITSVPDDLITTIED